MFPLTKPKPLPTEPVSGKATALRPVASKSPHLRAFYLAVLGHFAAFCSWFAISPLLSGTIAPDLGISLSDVASSDIANVASTVVFRIVVGAVTDKVGPKKAMAIVLALGAIPVACVGLVHNLGGLIAIRAFIGLLGAAFVPCQAWTTAFFAKSIVGTANAVAGGLGNSGAGVTYLLTTTVFNAFVSSGRSISTSWRITYLFPAAFCLIVAIACLLFGPIKPEPSLPSIATPDNDTTPTSSASIEELNVDKLEHIKDADDKKVSIDVTPSHTVTTAPVSPANPSTSALVRLRQALTPTLLLLIFQYACSFGVELSVNSTLSTYLQHAFPSQISQTTGSMLASTFALLNIVSRASGGLTSDSAMRKIGIRGRIMTQTVLLTLTAALVIAFSFAPTLVSTMVLLVLFAFCTEAASGALFGVLPYVADGNMGLASGLVGAGGTIGGAIFNAVFKHYVDDLRSGFRVMGFVVLDPRVAGSYIYTTFDILLLLEPSRGTKRNTYTHTTEKMVRAISGALIECDPAVRQILVDLDNQAEPDQKFIVKKLDETHLLIPVSYRTTP
ncbi:High-affinity nitrate transporter 2.1 [Rhizophlyctis rosea]|nr:High-affinity nitrate transporter 2.1 [Rhizophlyctis rosea]